MEVIASGQPSHAAAPDLLPSGDGVAHIHVERRQMTVKRLHAHAVIDHDAVSVNAEPARVQDPAGVRCHHPHRGRDRQIESEMRLLIDFLALVDVGAPIGE